ncbi:MAG: fluoride efflux transporter CrcB [Gammaproteobacteria bacterium]|nr:fluoride efflux transporter CrcB [Gammaproteobacteria bacterium]MBU1442281.1 fluoride efflux transporter CrcB [Gammaproteobacteria bacterium]MBU2286720.1 fluoride efflux transporter CrcB [Gammaproteobacteria bacterium]MBU2408439.1 fluoride efflux transporter CrcB [Gammaproteobacteria bacterium]
MSLLPVLAVFIGAGVGALLRWGLGIWLNPVFPTLPLGTLAANLVGGLLIGCASALFTIHATLSPEWRLMVITGFLGGLTTFSTFSLEIVTLLGRQQFGWALGAAAVHLVGSLLLTFAGIVLGSALLTRTA